ncbi:MAG: adenosylcobinamide-phosphate synthase CbiB [Methylomicrobium sp.]
MFELAALAYSIDLLFGEFRWTHPVVLMGRFIATYEQRFYRDSIVAGAGLVVALLVVTTGIAWLLVQCSRWLPDWLALIVLATVASAGLAMNMLHTSVASILTSDDPRQALSLLVSRDTEPMSETDIVKAAIETWAENLSDGVIAPLFYLLLFGLPGIAAYKAINTMDSMIGYKTDRYRHFGKTAARLDDIANFVPARLTALLIVLWATDKKRAWHCLRRDGRKLDSPNAGMPIAAMAGALGVSLGGDAFYHGRLKHKPELGIIGAPASASALREALKLKAPIDCTVLSLLSIAAVLF